MAYPYWLNELEPGDRAGFVAEYEEWLDLLREVASDPGTGGQVPTETLGTRADASRKARRVARLASRLAGREVR